MTNPPIGPQPILPPAAPPGAPQSQSPNNARREIDVTVQDAVRNRSLPPAPLPVESKGWFSSWFGGQSVDDDDSDHHKQSDSEESGGGEQGLYSEAFWEAPPPKVESSFLGSALGWVAKAGAKLYTRSYRSEDENEKLIAEQKRVMQGLGDQFVESYEFTKDLVFDKVKNVAEKKIPAYLTNLFPAAEIKKLVEITLAKGFANLARQVLQNQNEIPNFNEQPSLVSILSFICEKASPNINAKRLETIEVRFRDARKDFSLKKKNLFADSLNAEKEALIREYIQTPLEKRRVAIEKKLFPSQFVDEKKLRDIHDFFELCKLMGLRHQELNQLFSKLADDVLILLFPNKLSDLELPPVLDYLSKVGFVKNQIYSYLIQYIADLLQESYEPMENDATRTQDWEANLQSRVGAPNLMPVIEAPASLLVAFTKNYIQTDPSVLGLTAAMLEGALHPQEEQELLEEVNPEEEQEVHDAPNPQEVQAGPRRLTEEEKHAQLMAQLSHQKLANWIVQSTQAVLHTEDPNLTGLGRFLKQVLNNLSTALLSKGVKWVIPDGEEVEKDQFIKVLTDGIVARFVPPRNQEEAEDLLRNQEITKELLSDFVQDLPLPPLVKGMLPSLLVKKVKKLKVQLENNAEQLAKIETIRHDSEVKIRSYDRGEELWSIMEKSTDQITEWLLTRNVGLISTFGLSDTLDELIAQYLPGVKINDDLKGWFKKNISALEVTEEGASPETTQLLRKGIQAVLSRALVNTIEKGLKGESKDYAANLLKNFRRAFLKMFHGFDKTERARLDRALAVQREIDTKEKAIAQLRSQIEKKPKGLSLVQHSLLNDMHQANTRVVRAEGYLVDLKKKREEIFKKLNGNPGGRTWSVSDLPHVNEALILARAPRGPLLDELRDKADKAPEEEIFLSLIKMPSDALKLLSDAFNIEVTLEHAENERNHLSVDLESKKRAVQAMDQEASDNRAEWENGKKWAVAAISSRSRIQQLSKEVAALEVQLDTHLQMFRLLSNELMVLAGIEKDVLQLPKVLEERVWPLIEDAKKQHIARALFKQLTPLLVIVSDREENREKLDRLSKGTSFMSLLASTSAKEMMRRIPEFVTSYKPFVREILVLMGIAEPTTEEIGKMEAGLRSRLVGLGKTGTVSSMLLPLVLGIDLVLDKSESLTQEEKEASNTALLPKKKAISEALEFLISSTDKYREISVEEILPLLKKEVEPGNPKEERILQSRAKELANSVNSFLLHRGKGKVKPTDILQAFRSQRDKGHNISADQVGAFIEGLKAKKIIEKLQTVVVTPEEIGHILNDIIPGQTDLQPLFTAQVQAIIGGEEEIFKENREFIQKFVEGFLLKIFVKIVQANEEKGHSVLAVLGRKLQEAIPDIKKTKGNPEELARGMIDGVLRDGLAIASESDLVGVPPAVQEQVYKKIKEQAYNLLTPLLLPMIERVQDRARLEEISGNRFLGSLSVAVSRDLFRLLPAEAESYITQTKLAVRIADLIDPGIREKVEEETAAGNSPQKRQELIEKKIAKEVADRFDPKLLESLAVELQGFIDPASEAYQNVSSFSGSYVQGVLVKAFIRIAEKNPAQDGKDTLIVITEKLLELAGRKLQDAKILDPKAVAGEFNDEMMKDILGIDSPDFFEGLPPPLKVEVFNALKTQIGGMVIAIQQSLTTLESDNKKVKSAEEELKEFGEPNTEGERRSFGLTEGASKGYAQILADDLANMAMTAVPNTLTEAGGERMRGVNAISKAAETYLEELARGNLELAKVLLNYGRAPQFQEMLENKLGEYTAKVKLEEHIAKKLSDKIELTPAEMEAKAAIEDKAKAAALVSNLLLVPLSRVLKATSEFEEKQQAEFNQKLMANILDVAAGHLKNLNEAKAKANERAKLGGRADVLYQDFVAAAGTGLHPAVPTKPVTYQRTLEVIGERLYKLGPKYLKGRLDPKQLKIWETEKENLRKAIAQLAEEDSQGKRVISMRDIIAEIEKINEKVVGSPKLSKRQRQVLLKRDDQGFSLRDLIRQEKEANVIQREKQAFDPAVKVIMKMLLPNGKNDLDFVPENMRTTVWNMFEKNLFPVVLPLITELLLDPDVIHKIVLKSLEAAKESLEEDFVLDKEAADDLSGGALKRAAGKLVGESLKGVKLPGWIKSKIIDPVTGEVSPAIEDSLGEVLCKQFNDTFIRDKLKLALENLVKRDEKGDYLLNLDDRPKDVKAAELEPNRKKMKKDLKRLSREVVDLSISYFIKSKWTEAQARFDVLVERAFGKIGRSLKLALDAVFNFIFFKIIGTVLSIVFYPVKLLVKEGIYRMISLDENREAILDMLTRVPDDQPEGEHVGLHEDLLYKAGQKLKETVDQALKLKNTIQETLEEPILEPRT